MIRPYMRSATLDGYVRLARSCNLEPDRLLPGVGLNPADLAAPDNWIPAAAAARLLDLSARESDRSDFSLRLAGLRRPATLGPLSVVLREEPDLRSALDLLLRYEHSYNEALRLRLAAENGLSTVRLWLEFGEPAPTRQALELTTGALFGIMRQLAGDNWAPLAICFTHGPPDRLDTHWRMFGPRLHFRHEFTGVVFYESTSTSATRWPTPCCGLTSRA